MKKRLLVAAAAFLWLCALTASIQTRSHFWAAFGFDAVFFGSLAGITALITYAMGLWGSEL